MAKDCILEFKAFCNAVLTDEMIDSLSKAMTEYVFRGGPIEDMHANNQLSQDDMCLLNKEMVNRFAGLFVMLRDGQLNKIDKVLSFYERLAFGWDDAVPNLEDFKNIR